MLSPPFEVPAEPLHVGFDIGGRLFECNEHPVLAALRDAVREKLGGEHRLSTSGGSSDEGRAPARHASNGQLIESFDSGWRFIHRVHLIHGHSVLELR